MNSIRARLLLGLMLALCIALLLLLSANWYGARRELGALFDAHLQQSAAIVLLWTQTEPRQGEVLDEARFRAEIQSLLPLMQGVSLRGKGAARSVEQQRDLAYTILCAPVSEAGSDGTANSSPRATSADDCMGVVSSNAPSFLQERVDTAGFSMQLEGEGGALWHVYTARDAQARFSVRVAERDDVRKRLITGIVLRQLGLTLPLLPLAGILVWLVIGRGLLPLRRLSEEISRRREQLLQPITAVAPEEVKVLVDALNQLFSSAGAALNRERRFSAAVAHELRTPLSIIRTRAELAASRATADDAAAVFTAIVAQCERAARVLDQLLELARVADDSVLQNRRSVDLPMLAREVMADLSNQADAQGVELVLVAEHKLPGLVAEPISLSILLRNLIENAIRHAPSGTEVHVGIEAAGGGVLLRVCDPGAGMSAAQRAHFQNIMRAEMPSFDRELQSDQTGYGLGLLLVQRIASLHAAAVSLSTPASGAGLCVAVVLPVPA